MERFSNVQGTGIWFSVEGAYESSQQMLFDGKDYVLTDEDKQEIADMVGKNLLTVETIIINDDAVINVTGITLDYSSISLTVGESMMLAASVAPTDATNNTVLWSSSNDGVASVDGGLVTAVTSGSAVITATSAENESIKATCFVEVEPVSGEVKVPLSSAGMQSGLLKKDGVTVYDVSQSYHVEIPYVPGMTISTIMNAAWLKDYPAFIVNDNSTITIPETTIGEGNPTPNAPGKNYVTTLDGYSEGVKVFVNIYADSSSGGNVTVEEAMNSADSFWYSYTA